jgi:DNA gyrase subunit A
LEISPQDKILCLIAVPQKVSNGFSYLVMATKDGIIKKTSIAEFANVRRSGLIAITLKKGDSLRWVAPSSGEDEIILTTKQGQAIRFKEKTLREMGRPASGIKGIRLRKPSSRAQAEGGDEVVGMDVRSLAVKLIESSGKKKNQLSEKQHLLVLTEKGYGKRTLIDDYRLQGRGGSGIKTGKITPKTGQIIADQVLAVEEDLIVISQKGQVIRTPIDSIPKLSRATQGVRIMKLEEGDRVASAICI